MEKQLFKVVHTDGVKSLVGISLLDKKVDLVHVKGRMLTLEQWGLVLMMWTPTASAVREYCTGNRKNKFTIESVPKEVGRATDLKLVVFEPIGSGEFHITKQYSEMHISMCDKLNYGWEGYVGDFVEFLVYYYEGTRIPNVFRLEVDTFEWPMRIDGFTSDVDYVDLVALKEPPMYRKQYRLDQEYPGPEQEDTPDMVPMVE